MHDLFHRGLHRTGLYHLDRKEAELDPIHHMHKESLKTLFNECLEVAQANHPGVPFEEWSEECKGLLLAHFCYLAAMSIGSKAAHHFEKERDLARAKYDVKYPKPALPGYGPFHNPGSHTHSASNPGHAAYDPRMPYRL